MRLRPLHVKYILPSIGLISQSSTPLNRVPPRIPAIVLRLLRSSMVVLGTSTHVPIAELGSSLDNARSSLRTYTLPVVRSPGVSATNLYTQCVPPSSP